MAGESYPQAVLRTIDGLKEDDRARLRELVAWAREYEIQERKQNEKQTR